MCVYNNSSLTPAICQGYFVNRLGGVFSNRVYSGNPKGELRQEH